MLSLKILAKVNQSVSRISQKVTDYASLVVIDRKYERSEDTGRFELIHKGTLVAVPNYVGIDLRVEGKTYKTNRTHVSRRNNTKTDAPASAPAATTSSKKLLSDSMGLPTDDQDTLLETTQSSVDFTTNKKTIDDPASSTKDARDAHVSKINLGECLFEEDGSVNEQNFIYF